jgi:hypothetical protein
VREEVGKRKEREERRKGREKGRNMENFPNLKKLVRKKDNLWNWYKIYFL